MTEIGAEEFRAAGIYDPDAAGAAERLELLEYLDSRGVCPRHDGGVRAGPARCGARVRAFRCAPRGLR